MSYLSSGRRQHRLPTATLTAGSTTVALVSSVHDLGIFVDSIQTWWCLGLHVCQTVSCCFAELSATQQPPSCPGDRLPIACHCLWQRYVGWSSSPSHPSTYIVGSELSGTSASSFRPHQWCACQPSLVTTRISLSAGKNRPVFKVAAQTYRALHADAPLYLR